MERIFHLADDWNFYSSLGIKIGYVFPTIVIEDLNQESTLGHNEDYFRQFSSKNVFVNNLMIVRRYIIGFLRKLFLKLKIMLSKN